MELQSTLVVIMILYFSGILFWGFYQGKKVKSGADFSIAGRKLPGWVAALSERATGESSWALLGLPGAAYATGLLEVWTAIGCVMGILVAWIFLAGRLRDEAARYQAVTFTDFLAKRHGEVGKWIRISGSLTIVFFFFFYVGAQFIGGGKTLNNLFGMDQDWAMLLIVLLVIPYTIYGGFRSVTYTDVIQAILMIVTLIVAPIAGIFYLRSHKQEELFASSMSEALEKAGSTYSSLTEGLDTSALQPLLGDGANLASGLATGIVIAGAFSWFFGYLGGQPQLTTRFMAIKSKKDARIARNIGVIWTVIAYTGALCVGYIGLAIFGPQGLTDQETVMPSVLTTVFPPIISGILITGVLAAIISTANSLLILSATEFSENLMPRSANSNNGNLRSSRLITGIMSLIALAVAYWSPSDLIYTIVSFVWAGIGSTFSVVILLTLFWKRYHGKAALWTIIIGVIFTLVWMGSGWDQVITSRLMTFIVALAVGISTTFLIQKKQTNNE
ncbi:sodium/proline symporter [Aureitalea marina]|uniref:Sodium/proline symporter n=1 Tax=Aureitalea marina TaxID=930804 RepID=A0A2S7KN76_9FLAO|nr:sodium/proline symporter [Aureitalea marina]PQB04040.1 sodium:proline symporter [Aureitalea marina]